VTREKKRKAKQWQAHRTGMKSTVSFGNIWQHHLHCVVFRVHVRTLALDDGVGKAQDERRLIKSTRKPIAQRVCPLVKTTHCTLT